MNSKIKEYIEQHINLIEDGYFARLYDKPWSDALSNDIFDNLGQMTEALLLAGIDPLENIDYIPCSYLANSNIDTFRFPSNVKQLFYGSFFNTKLKNIILPEGITEIPEECFGYTYLDWIQIPKSVTKIHPHAFEDDNRFKVICYKNSFADMWAEKNDHVKEYIQ